ncbi:unnamed protein product [Rotaria socialis]|uniref:TRUD domain-containing protein n=2 Tax=Rotaria TaxID=231623 RepID=A0A820V1P6_9BILA|nr:unnamed protein product [Rotaria socialis]CAF4494037.1 unnamed protein product [Rotaria socialis]
MDSNDKTSTETIDEPVRKRMRTDNSSVTNPEETVGITQFLSNHEGFDGIIKYRYSDFLVNEISSDGVVIHLTDLSCPDFGQNKSNLTTNVPLSDEVIDRLKALSQTHGKDLISIPVDDLTKEQRTSIHHFVRSININLKSELVNGSIQVTYQPIATQVRRATEQWPDKSKPYLKFVLYKENRDTMDTIQNLGACVNMNASLFQYAGIKDKRGKTCQEITIHKVLPSKFKNINQRIPSLKVGNFQLCESPLRLGQLQGNRFEIFIRNITIESDENIKSCVNNFIEKGFINYFGLQRFGSRTLATQTVGKYLLQHNWSQAIDAILAYDETITQNWLRQLLNQWNKTHDIKTILDGTIPYRRSIEVDLLRGLQKHDQTNLIGALSSIPRNTRLLYLHAYQSMIWNKIVSKRLNTYGTEILVGDLYMNDIHNDSNVSFVTETNRNDIKLEQIVLPLPGYDIKYPLNDIYSWYRDLLNEDGIKIDQMKYQVKDYSLPGNYRQFIVRTGQVDYRIVHYDNMNDDPLQSDYDRLMNRDNNLQLESNKYKGLILVFSLPKSSYATMALREILHRNESTLQTHHKEEQLSSTKETITNQDEEEEEEQEQEIEDVV